MYDCQMVARAHLHKKVGVEIAVHHLKQSRSARQLMWRSVCSWTTRRTSHGSDWRLHALTPL